MSKRAPKAKAKPKNTGLKQQFQVDTEKHKIETDEKLESIKSEYLKYVDKQLDEIYYKIVSETWRHKNFLQFMESGQYNVKKEIKSEPAKSPELADYRTESLRSAEASSNQGSMRTRASVKRSEPARTSQSVERSQTVKETTPIEKAVSVKQSNSAKASARASASVSVSNPVEVSECSETFTFDEPATPVVAPVLNSTTLCRPDSPPSTIVRAKQMMMYTPAGRSMRVPSVLHLKNGLENVPPTMYRSSRYDEVLFSVNGSPVTTSTPSVLKMMEADPNQLSPVSREISKNIQLLMSRQQIRKLDESNKHNNEID